MTQPKPEPEEQEPEPEESGDTDSNASTHVKDTVLLLKEQMKMRRQEQDFIRHSLHTREVGEVYQLSSIQRRGLAEVSVSEVIEGPASPIIEGAARYPFPLPADARAKREAETASGQRASW